MATRFYGVAVGGHNAPDVTIGSSTTSKDVELAVVDTNLPAGDIGKKLKVLAALDAIRLAVMEDDI